MKLFRYKIVSAINVSQRLKERMEFSTYQKSILTQTLEDLPYQFVSFEKPKKPNMFIRLTIPFFLIFWLLLILFMPIKWIITGNGTYDVKGNVYKLIKGWAKSLRFNI